MVLGFPKIPKNHPWLQALQTKSCRITGGPGVCDPTGCCWCGGINIQNQCQVTFVVKFLTSSTHSDVVMSAVKDNAANNSFMVAYVTENNLVNFPPQLTPWQFHP